MSDTTSELRAILERFRKQCVNKGGGIGFEQTIADLEALLAAQKQRWEAAARKDELTNFEPLFKGDHSKCPDPSTCIGYQNAESDFDNEKAIRLAALDGVIGEQQ